MYSAGDLGCLNGLVKTEELRGGKAPKSRNSLPNPEDGVNRTVSLFRRTAIFSGLLQILVLGLLAMGLSGQAVVAQTTAADLDATVPPENRDMTMGSYQEGTVGDPTKDLHAIVYRPKTVGGDKGPAPLVLVLHGQHSTCGRIYNPGSAGVRTKPQAKITVALGGATLDVPIAIIDVPAAAAGTPAGVPVEFPAGILPAGATQTYARIVGNTEDPPGLPCTRPAPGAACTMPIRLDNWLYDPAGAVRTCKGLTEAESYLGYEYLGVRLALMGYVVVSIDSNPINNLGNGPDTDFGLIQERGTLVINHLRQLRTYNLSGGSPNDIIPKGSLDLGQVALVGHSRGGEGVRAAYNTINDVLPPEFGVVAIFEIAPTDNGRDAQGRKATNVTWNVLLPMCDGDVSDLAGVRPFDRMMRDYTETTQTQKSTYTVWGANHNFYNSKWMVSDTFDLNQMGTELAARFLLEEVQPCKGTGNTALFTGGPDSPSQRLTALSSVLAFIRGNVINKAVVADKKFNKNFNPLFRLPATVINEELKKDDYPPAPPKRVDRTYSPTASCAQISVMEDFNQPTGMNTSGKMNAKSGVTVMHLYGQAAVRNSSRLGDAACTKLQEPFLCCTGMGTGTCGAGMPPPAPSAPPKACDFDMENPPTTTPAPPAEPRNTCEPAAGTDTPVCIPNHHETQRVG